MYIYAGTSTIIITPICKYMYIYTGAAPPSAEEITALSSIVESAVPSSSGHVTHIQASCSDSNAGVVEGFNWLSSKLSRSTPDMIPDLSV
jgi:hypothetical protein